VAGKQLQRLHQLAEAVADEDLGDLTEAPQMANSPGWQHRHR